MKKKQALKIPEWLKRSAVYQVNLRTFSEEGTIDSLRKELAFLKSLGFKIVYLCPVFQEDDNEDTLFWSIRQKASGTQNPKNPYRIDDYFEIDEEYGSMEDLVALIQEAHTLGMKIILDLVYMHLSPHAPIIGRHPDFVQRDENGKIVYSDYKFPLTNFESAGLREYLWCNMTYLIGETDADGFRCDVGDCVPDDFWAEGRRRIRAIKPDAVLINEGCKFERLATTFDSCYAFEYQRDLYKVFSGEITAKEMIGRENARRETIPENGCILRNFDTHDTVTDWKERMEKFIGNDGMELVTVLNYVYDGIPMVYCGNELADTATVNLFSNRFHRGRFFATDREGLKTQKAGIRRQSVITQLNRLLAENDAMCSTDFEWLNVAGENTFAFRNKGKCRDVVFVGNLGKAAINETLDFPIHSVLLHNNADFNGKQLLLRPYGYILAEI